MRRVSRILGPYPEPDGVRFVLKDSQGGRCSFKAATESSARELAEEALRRLRGEQDGLTVDQAIKRYESHLKDAKGNKPRAIATTTIRLRTFFSATARKKEAVAEELVRPLGDLLPKRCEALYAALSGRPCRDCKTVAPLGSAACPRCDGADLGDPKMKVDTHRNMLAEARTFLNWCCTPPRRWLPKNPLEQVRGVGKRSHGKKQLRLDEARRWIEHATALADRGDDGAIGALMTVTMGLSGEEITRRVVRDLDDKGRLLHIVEGKTAERRQAVPVPDDIRPYLLQQARSKLPEAPLFPGTRKAVFHWRDWPNEQVQRICRLAEVPIVTAHGMRGLRATLEVLGGRSLRDAADALRHVDESTTRQSYVDPAALEKSQQDRVLRLLRGAG